MGRFCSYTEYGAAYIDVLISLSLVIFSGLALQEFYVVMQERSRMANQTKAFLSIMQSAFDYRHFSNSITGHEFEFKLMNNEYQVFNKASKWIFSSGDHELLIFDFNDTKE